VCVNYAGQAEAAEAVKSKIIQAGGRAIAVRADVADEAAVIAMVERVAAELGPPTILVNNAGISHRAQLDSFDRKQFEQMRQVNVDGVVNAARAVVAGMRERRYGRIVNLASVAAIGTSLPGSTFYAATKAAIVILTRRFAMELGPYGITVNSVAPGFVRTDMTKGRRDNQEWERMEGQLAALAMTGRIGRPEDIANAVAFLAAPESDWITAQVLVVDGGRMDYIGHG
jgi:3-oxoacyl-[acyl-carrier protein] reductase